MPLVETLAAVDEEEPHPIEIAALHGWHRAKALYLDGCLRGDASAINQALAVLEEAVKRGGRSSWFNRMRASIGRAQQDERAMNAVAEGEFADSLIRSFDDHLERLGTSGSKFDMFVKQIGEGLNAESHGSYQEGLEKFGNLLGYRARRPRHAAATDCVWRGDFGNNHELLTFEAKIDHQPSSVITHTNVGQAVAQYNRVQGEYGDKGYIIRSLIVTHLEDISKDGASALGTVRLVSKDVVLALWYRVRTLITSYRSRWSLDDIKVRRSCAFQIRSKLPKTGWLLRAVDGAEPWISTGVRLFFVEEFLPYSWAFLPADASLQCSFRGDSNQASAYPRLSGGQPSLETVPNTVGLSPSGALPSGHSRGVLVRFHGQGDRPVMALTTGFQGRRFDVPEARTGVPRIDLPSPAPCAAADAVFADAKAFLSSNEARQMSESELERELHRRGQKLVRKLLQGHHDQRSPGQAAGPAEDASGVECSARREHDSHAETTSGTMQVVGLGCARRGHDGLHPLDAALNLLPERSLVDMRRRVTIATASRAPPRTPWKPQWYSTLSTWQRRCGVRCSSPSSLKACRHLARDRMGVDRRTVTLGCSCDGPQAATGRRRIDAY